MQPWHLLLPSAPHFSCYSQTPPLRPRPQRCWGAATEHARKPFSGRLSSLRLSIKPSAWSQGSAAAHCSGASNPPLGPWPSLALRDMETRRHGGSETVSFNRPSCAGERSIASFDCSSWTRLHANGWSYIWTSPRPMAIWMNENESSLFAPLERDIRGGKIKHTQTLQSG